jgi:hypothetical protein
LKKIVQQVERMGVTIANRSVTVREQTKAAGELLLEMNI